MNKEAHAARVNMKMLCVLVERVQKKEFLIGFSKTLYVPG